NAILGLTEGLLAGSLGPLEPRQGDALQIVERSGRHLLELISDVLDLAKIEAGKLDLAHGPTELPPLARACLEMMTPLARAKRLDLRADVPDDLPPCRFDERRIRQILLNLLSNAIKFTPEGGSVLFRAALQPDPTDPARAILCLSVRDSGIGIAPEDQARLFQPFSQIDSQYARAHEGTGLGLTLVRRLAELHGGSVELESAAGAGSTFRVLLPQSGVTIPAHTAAAAPPVPPRGSPPGSMTAGAPRTDGPVGSGPCRILYAEDNEANIVTLRSYLEAYHFEVHVARDGLEALDAVARLQPDLVLMDVQMPRLDGLEATRRIRAQPAFAHLPIIAVTALAMPSDRAQCLAAGATDYMTKPLRLRALLQRIRELVAHAPTSRHDTLKARLEARGSAHPFSSNQTTAHA
ncbi:MAG: hybrid sensor histidine kinase/response regulator, partial [Verrucomicrobiota bacterium]